jgi:hypothetical protein
MQEPAKACFVDPYIDIDVDVRMIPTDTSFIQVYACLVPVVELQEGEQFYTVIHEEELMLNISKGNTFPAL